MIAARIARRLVRKLAKPAALWLNARALTRAEERASYYHVLRHELVVMELAEGRRALQLTARRRDISTW